MLLKIQNMMDTWVFFNGLYILLIKKSLSGALTRADKSANKSKTIPKHQHAEKLHKSIIRNFEKRKV